MANCQKEAQKKRRITVDAVEAISHAAIMRSMRAQVEEVTSSPEKAIAFLKVVRGVSGRSSPGSSALAWRWLTDQGLKRSKN